MLDLLLLIAVITAVGYPLHGAVMYGDPWKWPLKRKGGDHA